MTRSGIPPGTTCKHTIKLVGIANTDPDCGGAGEFVKSDPITVWISKGQSECTGGPPEDENVSCDQKSPQVGRPVHLDSGKMHHKMVDLRIDGPIPIEFARRFDTTSHVDGAMGYGWQHNYMMRLEELGAAGTKTFVDQEMRRISFNCANTSSGACIAWDPDLVDHLTLTPGTNPPWQIRDKYGKKLDFNSTGQLTRISDRNGNSVAVSYSGAVTTVADQFGRGLTITAVGGRVDHVVADDRTVSYHYDAYGNLETVKESDPNTDEFTVATYTYLNPATTDNLITVTDADGKILESHEYTQSSDYVDAQVTRTKTNDDLKSYEITYDPLPASFLTSTQTTVTNGRDVTTTYTVNPFLGVATDRIEGPGCPACGDSGDETHQIFDSRLNKLAVGDGKHVWTTMTYDVLGNVLSRRENSCTGVPSGQNCHTGGPSRLTTYTYDTTTFGSGFSQPTTIRVPSVGTCQFAEDHDGNRVTSNTYSARGNLTARTIDGCNGSSSVSQTTTFSYDEPTVSDPNRYGQLLSIDGPRDNENDVLDTTTFEYYSNTSSAALNNRGRLHSITNALNQTTYLADYDLFGNVGKVTDPNGVVTLYTYDVKDHLTSARTLVGTSTSSADFITKFIYHLNGNLWKVRLPRCVDVENCEFSAEFVYEGVNWVKEIHDPAGNKVVFTYDEEGSKLREEYRDSTDTIHKFTNFAYDNFNRLSHIRFNDPPAFPHIDELFYRNYYGADGTRDSVKDPLDHVTTFTYDELKRLKTSVETIDSEEFETQFGYDIQDNLAQVTDPRGLTTNYVNSDLGWRLQTDSPDTNLTIFEYDPAGNLIHTTIADSVTVDRTYDPLNRLLAVQHPDSSLDVAYAYDSTAVPFGIGRRTGMTDPSGETMYGYDRRGLLVSEDKSIRGTTFATGYDYDKNGNLKEIRYPSIDARYRQGIVDYEYDDADRVSRVTAELNGRTRTIAESLDYAPFGPRTSMVFGNSLSDARSYDVNYQPIDWTLGSLLSYSHVFNPDLNLTTLTDNLESANSRSFGYDPLHRLTSAAGPWGSGTGCTQSKTYTYDKNGNRTCSSDAMPSSATYSSSSNHLASFSLDGTNFIYDHDVNGNVTDDGVHSFEYSDAQRLMSVDGGSTATYMYDGESRRAEKSTPNAETLYFYDPAGRLLTELIADGGGGGNGKDYLHLPDGPVARLDWSLEHGTCEFGFTCSGSVDESLLFYHNNYLGTPIALTDQDANVRWRVEYLPFGELFSNSIASTDNNLRFPGQYFDDETELQQNWFRDYSPKTGRYMEADPIGLWSGNNLYSYVRDNPIMFFDPTGLREYPNDFIGPLQSSDYRTSQMTSTRCGRIPPTPSGASIDQNMLDARQHLSLAGFVDKVRNNEQARYPDSWDYKQLGAIYLDAGNFNFGAAGTSFGFPEFVLRRGAGWANQKADPSDPTRRELGDFWGRYPYGDFPEDQEQIGNGIRYCECMRER